MNTKVLLYRGHRDCFPMDNKKEKIIIVTYTCSGCTAYKLNETMLHDDYIERDIILVLSKGCNSKHNRQISAGQQLI